MPESRKEFLQMIFARPVSKSVEEYHDQLLQTHWPKYQTFAKELSKVLDRFPAFSKFYTDHGRGHSYRIIENLTRIIPEKRLRQLQSGEKFILACAAWCHDIGMVINRKIVVPNSSDPRVMEPWFQDIGLIKANIKSEQERASARVIHNDDVIRKWHHVLSEHFILDNYSVLGLEHPISRQVASICRFHSRQERTELLNDYDRLQFEDEDVEIHPRTLAAFFQLADALDTDFRRGDEIICDYVQSLPNQAKDHWKVCGLISSFYPNYDENKIVLRGIYKDDSDRKLLEWKVDHLISEYEDIRSVLNSEPYKLDISDICCEAENQYRYGEKIIISGIGRLAQAAMERSLSEAKQELHFFKDLKVTHTFSINEKGDINAVVGVETQIIKYPQEISRLHWVECLDNPCEWDWENVPVAYDDKQRLTITPVEDRSNFKSFRILLPSNLPLKEVYRYSYKWFWPKFFPGTDEYYYTRDIVPHMLFDLTFPHSYELEEIVCRERQPGGIVSTVKEVPDETREDDTERRKVYIFDVKKSHEESSIEVRWRRKMGGAGK